MGAKARVGSGQGLFGERKKSDGRVVGLGIRVSLMALMDTRRRTGRGSTASPTVVSKAPNSLRGRSFGPCLTRDDYSPLDSTAKSTFPVQSDAFSFHLMFLHLI